MSADEETVQTCCACTLLPPRDLDRRALADHGLDIEVVDQSLGSGQAHAEATATRPAVAHRLLEIRDARSLVNEAQVNTTTTTVAADFPVHVAATAILERIASKLARRGDELRLVDK